MFVVSVMPCVAKKFERTREQMPDDVDSVITTRERQMNFFISNKLLCFLDYFMNHRRVSENRISDYVNTFVRHIFIAVPFQPLFVDPLLLVSSCPNFDTTLFCGNKIKPHQILIL